MVCPYVQHRLIAEPDQRRATASPLRSGRGSRHSRGDRPEFTSRTRGGRAQPHRSRAIAASNFWRSSSLMRLDLRGRQDRTRARPPPDRRRAGRTTPRPAGLCRAIRSDCRLGTGLASACPAMPSSQYPYPDGRWRRSASEAPRRTASAASTDFTLGIVPPENASSAFERVAADGAAQRVHQPVRGSVGKEDASGQPSAARLFPCWRISPAAGSRSIQYSRSTIGTVIGLKSNGE